MYFISSLLLIIQIQGMVELGAPLFQSCGKLRVGPRLPSRSFDLPPFSDKCLVAEPDKVLVGELNE